MTLPRWNRFNDLPDAYAGERGGFLGSAFDPWLVRSSSAEGLDFEPDVMTMPAEVGPGRIEGRRRLLERLDARLDHLAAQGEVRDHLVKRAGSRSQGQGVVLPRSSR